eukprot:scaffold40924_cov34-Attheya_sp.AAC.4
MSNPQIAKLMAEVDTPLKSEVNRLKSELEREKKKNEIKKKRSKGNLTIQEDEPPQEKKKRQTKSVVNVNLVVTVQHEALLSIFWTYDGGIAHEQGLIAKVMDLRGGTLNYEGVEIMCCSLEVKGRRNFCHSMTHLSSAIKIQVKAIPFTYIFDSSRKAPFQQMSWLQKAFSTASTVEATLEQVRPIAQQEYAMHHALHSNIEVNASVAECTISKYIPSKCWNCEDPNHVYMKALQDYLPSS